MARESVDDQAWWARESEFMRAWFPLSFSAMATWGGKPTRIWRVYMNPYPPPEEMYQVLADLEANGGVDLSTHGRVRHADDCVLPDHVLRTVPWDASEVKRIPVEPLLVELAYRRPPGHPRVTCITPAWSKLTLPDHPHFYLPNGICPLFPPDGDWTWSEDTAADYLQNVALWALKTWVWLATGRHGRAIWLGSEQGHSPEDLRIARPNAQCTCGSGLPFDSCCRRRVLGK